MLCQGCLFTVSQPLIMKKRVLYIVPPTGRARIGKYYLINEDGYFMAQETYSSRQEAKQLLIDENPDVKGIFAKYLEPWYTVIFPNAKQIKKIDELNKQFEDPEVEDAYIKQHWLVWDKTVKPKEDDNADLEDLF